MGKCVLYQMQGCLTTRSYIGSSRSDGRQDSRPRFTLDQLETLYDEVWEAEHEVGPRVELVEAFSPHAAKVAELEAKGDLANSLKQNRCAALTDLVRRFWGWEIGNWDEKAQKVRRVLTERPRQCEDWRHSGASAEIMEQICIRTQNPIYLLMGRVIHRFVPPGYEQLSADQRRDRQALALGVNEGHSFF